MSEKNIDPSDHSIDRRKFIEGSVVFGIAAVGAGAGLVGCSSGETSSGSGSEDNSGQSGSGSTSQNGSGSSSLGSQNGSSSTSSFTNSTGTGFDTSRSTPGGATVYATRDISPEGLLRVYQALGWTPTGNVALKLHMGEEGNTNYLSPELLRPLVEATNATFVDCTVAYGGRRSTADGYASLAADHGFTYAPVDILDRDGAISLPISGGNHLTEAQVGSHVSNYDSMISVAHFKGHSMAGFGGTFKNLGIGLGTPAGKRSVHGSGFSSDDQFLERIVEFSKGAFDHYGLNMACINVLNNLSVDCDCDGNAASPGMADIGIMASLDPLALDQASVDQVYLSNDPGKDALIQRIESRNGTHLLDYAEQLDVGSRQYELVVIDS